MMADMRGRLRAALDLAAFAVHLACDFADAVRAPVRGVDGVGCDPDAMHAVAWWAVRGAPEPALRVTCEVCKAKPSTRRAVDARSMLRAVCDGCDPAPRVEPVAVGDKFTHADRPGAEWTIFDYADGHSYPYTLERGGVCIFATAAELLDPAGPWHRVTDSAPPTPVTHGAPPRRCPDPSCWVHDGEACARGWMRREDCEAWTKRADGDGGEA